MTGVLAVAGGTASGKSTLAEALSLHHPPETIHLVHLDDFYVPSHDPLQGAWTVSANGCPVLDWNHPGSIDQSAVAAAIDAAVRSGVRLVVVEGLFALALPAVASRATWRVFVDAPDDVRLARKILRKIEVQRQDPRLSLLNYLATGRQRHAEYVAPSRDGADLVVDGTASGSEMIAEVIALVGPVLADPVPQASTRLRGRSHAGLGRSVRVARPTATLS
jgi:uridine kinase